MARHHPAVRLQTDLPPHHVRIEPRTTRHLAPLLPLPIQRSPPILSIRYFLSQRPSHSSSIRLHFTANHFRHSTQPNQLCFPPRVRRRLLWLLEHRVDVRYRDSRAQPTACLSLCGCEYFGRASGRCVGVWRVLVVAWPAAQVCFLKRASSKYPLWKWVNALKASRSVLRFSDSTTLPKATRQNCEDKHRSNSHA